MSKDFWQLQKKPIVALAPMDGYTDSAFRRICKRVAPEIIVFTEFTSAEGLSHGAQKLRDRFRFSPEEQPVIAQIFGRDISSFVEAAKWLEQLGFTGIDLNMGCPASHVVKSEQGIALRREPELAFALVEAVAKATTLPVSVKTRLGWESAEGLTEFGQGLERSGADCLTIHGRTYREPYSGPAHFEPIYELKQSVSIPVLGNGGITTLADGRTKLGNLDGFMIGQAAIGNPWVFSDKPAPSFADRLPTIKEHLRLLIELKGPRVALLDFRKHLLAYVKGFPDAKTYRMELAHATSTDQIDTILVRIAMTIRDTKARMPTEKGS